MNEFFTWATLGTMAGATAAVALVVLFCAALFTGILDAPTAVLTVLNAIIVTLAANGLFNDAKSLMNKSE